MAGLLSGVLPAVYSAGDRAKRLAKQLLSDPMGYAAQTAGAIQDEARQQEQLMGQAFSNPQRPLQVTNPQALSQASNRMMTGLMGFAPAGITVWHGSPHTFSKFDASKIGTGEGAQAYGHGLYFAESPSVAREYQEKLSSTGGAKNLVRQYGDIDKAIAEAQSRIASYKELIANGGGGDLRRANGMLNIAQKNLEDLSAMKAGLPENTGSLYKVDLPDEAVAKMLDWDKPLSQQSKEVQKAWQATKKTLPPNAIEDLGGDLSMLYGKDVTPADFLGTMQSIGGRPDFGESLLKQQGVPGIRYLDQGSRGTGQGTSNFVVFPGNEGLLSILERNGKPIK